MAAGNLVFNVTANTTSIPQSIVQASRTAQAYLNKNPLNLSVNTRGLNNLNLSKALPLGKITSDAKDFEKSINAATSRVLAFSATVGSLYALGAALKSIVSTTIEVEKALTDIKVISGATDAEFRKLSKGIFEAATKTSESFQTASAAALEFSRQGLSVSETLKRTQAALVLTKTAGMSAEEAVSSLTATMNTFSNQISDVNEVVDKMTAVDNAFAVSTKDLAEGLSRVGNSSQEAGVSLNETLAAITALQQRTARGGSVIGNALKSIFTRVGRPENIDLLNQLGVSTQKVTGESRDAISVLRDLAGVYRNLGDAQRKQVSEQIAGLFQINQFQALLSDLGSSYSIVDQAVQKASNSTGTAASRMEKLNVTTDAMIKQTLTNFTELQSKIGSLTFDKPLKNVLGAFTANGSQLSKFLEVLNNIGTDKETTGSKIAEGIFKGIGNFITGPGLVMLTRIVTPVLMNIIKFTTNAFSSLSGANQQLAQMKQLEADINRLLQSGNQYYAQRFMQAKSVVEAERALVGLISSSKGVGSVNPMVQSLYQRGFSPQSSSPLDIVKSKPAGFIRKMQSRFADGYDPIQQEMNTIATSKDYVGHRNARPKIINARINGRTQNVVVNDKEKVIPNYANTGDHAILNPRQQRMGFAGGSIPRSALLQFVQDAAKTNKFFSLEYIKTDGTLRKTANAAFHGGNAKFERVRGARGEFYGKGTAAEDRRFPHIDMGLYNQAIAAGYSPEQAKKKAYRAPYFNGITKINGMDVVGNGYIPNYARMKRRWIGGGAMGEYSTFGRPDQSSRLFGVKSFPKNYLHRSVKEFLGAMMLSGQNGPIMPEIPGVYFPKVSGKLSRVAQRGSFLKEHIGDTNAGEFVGNSSSDQKKRDILRETLNTMTAHVMDKMIASNAFSGADLHGGNFSINKQGQEFLKKIANIGTVGKGRDTYGDSAVTNTIRFLDPDKREKLMKAFAKKGGKLSIYDPFTEYSLNDRMANDFARKTTPNFNVNDLTAHLPSGHSNFSSISLAGGSIPNLARARKNPFENILRAAYVPTKKEYAFEKVISRLIGIDSGDLNKHGADWRGLFDAKVTTKPLTTLNTTRGVAGSALGKILHFMGVPVETAKAAGKAGRKTQPYYRMLRAITQGNVKLPSDSPIGIISSKDTYGKSLDPIRHMNLSGGKLISSLNSSVPIINSPVSNAELLMTTKDHNATGVEKLVRQVRGRISYYRDRYVNPKSFAPLEGKGLSKRNVYKEILKGMSYIDKSQSESGRLSRFNQIMDLAQTYKNDDRFRGKLMSQFEKRGYGIERGEFDRSKRAISGKRLFADGYIPNYAGLNIGAYGGIRRTLRDAATGNFDAYKKLYVNKKGLPSKKGESVGGLYNPNDDRVSFSKDAGNHAVSILTHEFSHAASRRTGLESFLEGRYMNDTIAKKISPTTYDYIKKYPSLYNVKENFLSEAVAMSHELPAKEIAKLWTSLGFKSKQVLTITKLIGKLKQQSKMGLIKRVQNKTYADGSNPLAESFAREHAAKPSGSKVYSAFVNTHKYTGPVVANTKDEPNRTSLLVAAGTRGMNKGDGYIPNYAAFDQSSYYGNEAYLKAVMAGIKGNKPLLSSAEKVMGLKSPMSSLRSSAENAMRGSFIGNKTSYAPAASARNIGSALIPSAAQLAMQNVPLTAAPIPKVVLPAHPTPNRPWNSTLDRRYNNTIEQKGLSQRDAHIARSSELFPSVKLTDSQKQHIYNQPKREFVEQGLKSGKLTGIGKTGAADVTGFINALTYKVKAGTANKPELKFYSDMIKYTREQNKSLTTVSRAIAGPSGHGGVGFGGGGSNSGGFGAGAGAEGMPPSADGGKGYAYNKKPGFRQLSKAFLNKHFAAGTGGSFAASMALPMAAGMVDAFMPEKESGAYLSGTLNGAGMGAMFGAPGMAIGATVGLAATYANSPNRKRDKNLRKIQKEYDIRQGSINSLESGIGAEGVLQNLLQDPNASRSQIRQAQSALTQSISGINNVGMSKEVNDAQKLKGEDKIAKLQEIKDKYQKQSDIEKNLGETKEYQKSIAGTRSIIGMVTGIEPLGFLRSKENEYFRKNQAKESKQNRQRAGDFIVSDQIDTTEEGKRIGSLSSLDYQSDKKPVLDVLTKVRDELAANPKDTKSILTAKGILQSQLTDKRQQEMFQAATDVGDEDLGTILTGILNNTISIGESVNENTEANKKASNAKNVAFAVSRQLEGRSTEFYKGQTREASKIESAKRYLDSNSTFMTDRQSQLANLDLSSQGRQIETKKSIEDVITGGIESVGSLYTQNANQFKDPSVTESLYQKLATQTSGEGFQSTLSEMMKGLNFNDTSIANQDLIKSLQKIQDSIGSNLEKINANTAASVKSEQEQKKQVEDLVKLQRSISSLGGLRGMGSRRDIFGGLSEGLIESTKYNKISKVRKLGGLISEKEIKDQQDNLAIGQSKGRMKTIDTLRGAGISEEAINAKFGAKYFDKIAYGDTVDRKNSLLDTAKKTANDFLTTSGQGALNPEMATAIGKAKDIKGVQDIINSRESTKSDVNDQKDELSKVLDLLRGQESDAANASKQSVASEYKTGPTAMRGYLQQEATKYQSWGGDTALNDITAKQNSLRRKYPMGIQMDNQLMKEDAGYTSKINAFKQQRDISEEAKKKLDNNDYTAISDAIINALKTILPTDTSKIQSQSAPPPVVNNNSVTINATQEATPEIKAALEQMGYKVNTIIAKTGVTVPPQVQPEQPK
jgi:TP901 family phage tail tape measure protein